MKRRRYHYLLCKGQVINEEGIDSWTVCQFQLGKVMSTHSTDIRLCLHGDCQKGLQTSQIRLREMQRRVLTTVTLNQPEMSFADAVSYATVPLVHFLFVCSVNR